LAIAILFKSISIGQVILSGVEGGSNHRIAIDLYKNCSKTIEIRTTQGSVQNFKELKTGEIAFIQYDVLQQELYNDLANVENNTDSIRILLSLGNEEIHLIARAESNINYIGDLNNQSLKISIGSDDQGTSITASIIKKITGSNWTDVNLSFKESVKALLNKEIDALFFVGAAPVDVLEIFSKLAPHERNMIKLVPLSDKRLESTYHKATIKSGTYAWASYDVSTYIVKSLLICKVTGETAAQRLAYNKLLSALKTSIIKLQKEGHRQWKNVDFNFTGIDWEVHTEAKKLFLQQKNPLENP